MQLIKTPFKHEAQRIAPGAAVYFQTSAGHFAFDTRDEYEKWKREMKFRASTTPKVPVQEDRPPEPPLPTFQR